MPSSRSIYTEVSAAIRSLLATVPPLGASKQRRADWLVRKAEVLDMIAAVEPYLAVQAQELATNARYEAQATIREY